MPELPEVETIVRQLQRAIVGKKIKNTQILLPKIVKAPRGAFLKATTGATITRVWRRAKLLVLELNNGWGLLIHLKMTGQLIYTKTRNVIPAEAGIQDSGSRLKAGMTNQKYTHVIFNFSDGTRLFFNDLRQFGYIQLVKSLNLQDFFIKEKVGPEPLEEDFTLADFQALLTKRPKAKIKQFLMDPKNIAGIGNIYTDEILFFAGVNPLRRVKTLKSGEVIKVFEGIKQILMAAVKLKGTSASDYLDAFGRPGNFVKKLKVYGREGKKCVKCKGVVRRMKIGGRSAHFCPACQRLKS